jgi:hypothetical protein
MKPFHLLIVATTLCLPALVAAAVPVAAVFPMQARGLDTNSTHIVEDALSDGLIRTRTVRLLERSQMKSILNEQGFQKSGACDGSECAIQMGKLLGVEKGVIGSLGLLGKTYVVNARLIDIGTGEVLATSQRSVNGQIDNVLTDLVPQVVADLTRTSKKDAPASAPVSEAGSGKSHAWAWWTAGGLVVVGGAAAAVLLSGKSSGSGGNNGNNGTGDQTGSLTFTWNN